MNEQKVPEKKKYPIGRYVALLLALALLLAGVTFARYYGTGGVVADRPLARYDVTYTVDGINSTSFGNMNYWQLYGGRWAEQGNGNARTVRLTAVNNSDVAVNPKLRLTAPAEFWDNIALQVFDTVEGSTVAMGDPLTTQFVLADLVKTRTGGEEHPGPSGKNETHGYTYGGYRNWDTATEKTYSTANFDTFGQTGEGEVVLTMSGGLSESDGTVSGGLRESDSTVSGTVTATWNETVIAEGTTPDPGTGEGGTGEGTDPSQPAEGEQETLPGGVLSVTAHLGTETFSVGFTRKVGEDTAPAFYFDCTREDALFYTLEIDLTGFSVPAATEDAGGNRTPGTDTIVFALTWTNAVRSSDLTFVDTTTGSWDTTIKGIFNNFTNADGTAGSPQYNGATVTAAHIDVNDAPVVALSEGSYAATGELTRMRVRLFAGSAKKMEFMHIASLSSADGSYPHPMTVSGDIATCVGTAPTSVKITQYTATEFANIVNKSTIGAATEKSYALQIGVNFVQASESPAQP